MKFPSLVLGFVLVFSGCAGKPGNGQHSGSSGFVASTDVVWLSQMMFQRLSLSRDLAWTRFQTGTPAFDADLEAGELAAFAEQCARLGLPSEEARYFYTAQLEAASKQEQLLIKDWQRDRNMPPASFVASPQSLRAQIQAVDAQIIATFVRLRGIPQGRELKAFVIEKLESREIEPRVAGISARPLGVAKR